MASTYVDNFTLLDEINAQSVAATQYNLTEGGSINKDSYLPTSATTHTIPTALRSLPYGAILDDGLTQKSLYELLLQIRVNWDAAMCSLDDSSGVATTTYEAGCAFGSQSENILGTTYGIYPNGISTDKLARFFQKIVDNIAACNALLDADATITDTDYASTLNITFSAKTGKIPPVTTTTAFNIWDLNDTNQPNPASRITVKGIEQGALVDFLNTVVTNINALWVKLDADI